MTNLLLYARVLLYLLTALGLVFMATLWQRRGSSAVHREKLVLALFFVVLAVAISGRVLGNMAWQAWVTDYVGTPVLAVYCVMTWRQVLRNSSHA